MHLQYLSTETQEALLRCPPEAYALAVALATAYAVPRPSTPVVNIDETWEASKKGAEGILGWFNEARPLNLEKAIDCTSQIWKGLYEVAHGLFLEKVCYATSPLDLFGIGYALSEEYSCKLCENHAAIGQVLGAAVKAARQMQLNMSRED